MPRIIESANREPKSMLYSLHYYLLFFFWGGVFVLESNQHSKGVRCWDDLKDESDEE